MLRMRDFSITRKLTWMNMLVSGAALLLACGAFTTYEIISYRQTMVRDLSVQAQIIGANSVSALLFNDPPSAEATLAALRATPHVTSAWIYAPEGRPFAGYERDRHAPPPALPLVPNGVSEAYWFRDGQLALVRSVNFHEKLTAFVYMQSDLRGLYKRLERFGEIGIGVLLASLLAAFFASWISGRVVAKPIQDLSETARLVSRDQNYAVRAIRRGGRDEISALIDTFNGMLAQIQQRDDALQKTQERFNLALMSAGVGTWSLDIHNRLLTWDDYTYPLFGLKPGTFSGRLEDMKKLVHPDDWENVPRGTKAQVAANGTVESEFRAIWPDGSIHFLAMRSKVYRDGTGKAVRRAGVCWDITANKQAKQALTDSEERYRFLFEANPHSMWIYDPQTLAFLAVNDTAVEHFGFSREEFLKMKTTDLNPRVDERQSAGDAGAVNHGFEGSGTAILQKKDGTIIHVEFASHNLPFGEGNTRLVAVGDITDRKKLEDQLRQSQKMEAIGRLAGGVAHDFNNLLTIIVGYGQMVQEQLEPDDARNGYMTEILKASERAASLTRQLLAFSRQQVLAPRLLDLNELVVNTEKMLRRLIGEDIELATVLRRGLADVKADPGQIEQVIMNLVVNSRDAMPSGGKVTIETSNVELDESYSQEHPEVKPGHYVMLAVSDTGAGMDAETQKRIFEPFFTTKEKDKGTGLGLAMVYGIVKQSGGHIWVYSEINIGTVFKIYFPRCMESKEAVPALPEHAHSARGSETILLVEDEEALRMLVQNILQGRGYKVLAPKEVTEALALSENYGGSIHLLLTDVVMPKMSGRELAQQVITRHKGIKVIYMSGYTNDAIVQHGVLESDVAFLQKPFSPDSVVRKVQEVLDRS